jgi:uncharacterized protein (DUF433 family)
MNWNPVRRVVAASLAGYGRLTRRVVSSVEVLAGEPVFRGTRIGVEYVADLVRKGVPEAEIRQDFPALSDDDLAYAKLVVRFGKKSQDSRGRLRFKRRLT